MKILAGICAAGQSSRMGFDKLATPIPNAASDGDCLLARALAATAHMAQCVALPAETAEYFARRRAIASDVDCVQVHDGMSASVRALAGVALDAGADGLLVQLADMPFITRSHVDRLVAVFTAFDGQKIIRAASEDGGRGHPVVFPRALLPAFSELEGDVGARELIQKHRAKPVVIGNEALFFDVDTPNDWDYLSALEGKDP